MFKNKDIIFFLLIAACLSLYNQQINILETHAILAHAECCLIENEFSVREPCAVLSYQKREKRERGIVFLEDNDYQKFVLKAYGDDQREEMVCEYVGAFIGNSVGVPINKVKIIRGGSLLVEIDNGALLATLHTFVPGKELCKWFERAPNDILLKGGLISEKHLNCLSLSNDLCAIMALDIFLNNKDRHHENCFFDEKNDRYYAIDMGDIFLPMRKIPNLEVDISCQMYQELSAMVSREKVVALDTYDFLNSLDTPLSALQKKALKNVSLILENLVALYPAERIFSMWILVAQEIGCVYTEYKKSYLRLLLEANMYWVQEVIEKINDLVNN